MTSSVSRRGSVPPGMSVPANSNHGRNMRRWRANVVNKFGGPVPAAAPSAPVIAVFTSPISRRVAGGIRGLTITGRQHRRTLLFVEVAWMFLWRETTGRRPGSRRACGAERDAGRDCAGPATRAEPSAGIAPWFDHRVGQRGWGQPMRRTDIAVDLTEPIGPGLPGGTQLDDLVVAAADEVPPHDDLLAERWPAQQQDARRLARPRAQLDGGVSGCEVGELGRVHRDACHGQLSLIEQDP